MLKKILIYIMILNLYTAALAVPPIYPVTMEMKLDRGRAQSKFTIFNTGKEKKRYKISIRQVDNLGEASLFSEYLRVFPKYAEIDPGNKQVVRVLVKDFPKEEVIDGEYRASISIEELDSGLEKKYQRKNKSEGLSTVINFKYKVNMAVYGYLGDLKHSIKIEEISLDSGVLYGTVANTGNYSYPLKYQLLNKKGKVLEERALPKLMWNERKKIQIQVLEEASLLKILDGERSDVLYESDISS